jgi:hypothetical protein
MSEGNLIAFGAVVSFIVVAGVYVFAREKFFHANTTADERTVKLGVTQTPSQKSV